VSGDLTAFAASIFMRGCGLVLVSTTLLGMVDASLGGKTGFDLFGMKNLAGTFYPASHVYMPLDSLSSLPALEWKSGWAELIKTAIIDSKEFFGIVKSLNADYPKNSPEKLRECVTRAAAVKGRIVEADPKETGQERILLNLGHTFGHALESSAGLGSISHGEAVAWGIARSVELGLALQITPQQQAEEIKNILCFFGYETKAPHPLMGSEETFLKVLSGDKKKKAGKSIFIVPGANSVMSIKADTSIDEVLLKKIINGELLL
jgi:3-dehydroquinate synthase